MSGSSPKSSRVARRLAFASVGASAVAALALFVVHRASGSQLALAQAADSLADTLSGVALLWAIGESRKPPDEGHPLGHARAEPIAAMVVAVLAGVLAVEVTRGAIAAIISDARPRLDGLVALVFAMKVIFKGAVVVLAARASRARANPVLDALRVDARNDVLVGGIAIVGYALAATGLPSLDAWLAIAVAAYIAFAAVELGRENIALLMGAAAPAGRHEELRAIAVKVPGVRRVDSLVATWSGALLMVHCDIAVDRSLSLLEAHAIGHAVEAALLAEDDVSHTHVHVGPFERRSASG